MNVEVAKLPQSRVKLAVELTPQEVDQALERTYKQLVQRVSIPGFRKGKAPRAVVERLVGPEFFLHEATDEAVRWGYRKAIDEAQVSPIDEAEIDAGEEHGHIRPGEPFSFTATVDVRPEVKLPDYHAIEVEPSKIEVDEADVDKLLHRLQENYATLEPTVRPAGYGDVITMNVVARVDGEEVLNNDSYDFELRDESVDDSPADPVFPGLSEQLVGVARGDIRELVLALPEVYNSSDLAGKSMVVRILVKEIKYKVLPALDDEFAQTLGEFETIDQVREALRGNLEMEQRMEADQKLVNDAIEALTSRSFIEIPPVLIDDEVNRMLRELREMFEGQHLSFENYLETTGRSEDDLRSDMIEDATKNVKTSLVLGSLADAEKIEVSNREIDAALEELFRTAATSESERRRLRTSTAARANVRSRIRRQRAIQKLVELVTGGEEVSTEAAAAVADQTAGTAEDTEETVAVEVGG